MCTSPNYVVNHVLSSFWKHFWHWLKVSPKCLPVNILYVHKCLCIHKPIFVREILTVYVYMYTNTYVYTQYYVYTTNICEGNLWISLTNVGLSTHKLFCVNRNSQQPPPPFTILTGHSDCWKEVVHEYLLQFSSVNEPWGNTLLQLYICARSMK